MRKIYSLVLMATMLLIGANVKAQVATVSINGGAAAPLATSSALTDALLGLADGAAAVFTLNDDVALGDAQDVTGSKWFDGGKSITFNLNNHQIDCYIRFNLKHASLYIVGPGVVDMKIANIFAATYGSKVKDEPYGYSTLTIGEGVTINSANQYALGIFPRDYADATYTGSNTKCNGTMEQDDWKVKYGAGAGVTININGTVTSKYGVSSNGQLAATVGNVPVINVGANAHINTSDYNGIYAGGYAIWNIKGEVTGLTGVYAKAGVFNLDGATITGTGEYEKPTTNNNGTSGGGSGIVLDGNNAYAGEMELHVTGNTVVTSTEGAAVEELVTSANESETKALEIQSGTFNGSVQLGSLTLTAELGQDVQINGTITGGTYNSDISEYLSPSGKAVEPVDDGNGHIVYQVVEGRVATLNAQGLATFSCHEYNVVLPVGLEAYKATVVGTDEVTFERIAVGDGEKVLPVDAGFVLKGNEGSYSLPKSTASAITVSGNLLKPSTEWAAGYKNNAYILHGGELWIYNGDSFKDDKAFLPISGGTGAPKRISFRYDAPTSVENVEATIKSSNKEKI